MLPSVPIDRLRFAEQLRPREVIGWPQGPGEPLSLTEALLAQGEELESPALFFGITVAGTLRPEHARRFALRALNGAGTNRRISDLADIVPCHVSQVPALLRGGQLAVDVALIQVRPLPEGGFSLGVIADYTQALIRQARRVIALVNPALPAMRADARVEAEDIDPLVEADERIADMPDAAPSSAELGVAEQVAALIPDRATVELGIGTLPAAVAAALRHHRGLGIHTGVISDALVDLVERGVVTNAHKDCDAGRSVTGGLFGTRRLRDFAERSGAVDLRSVEYTHHIGVASRLPQFHTINSAIEVDLSGQANAEVAGTRYLGAVGGQLDFVRCGVASPGGRSIIALASTTTDGRHSRIVASLQGRPVTTPRSDIDIVVTEHGAAHLRGCSFAERARRLIAIAHPGHRESLERELNERRGAMPAAAQSAA